MGGKRPEPIDKEVALRIRACRTSRGMSQNDLAVKLGVTFQQIQKYERGINRIGAGRLFELAQVFGVPVQSLFPDQDAVPNVNDRRLADFTLSADAWRLCKAFLEISSPEKRKAVIALVQEMREARDETVTEKKVPVCGDA